MASGPLDLSTPRSSDLAAPRAAKAEAARPRFRSKKKGRTGWMVFGAVVLAAAAGGVALKLRPVPVTTTPIIRGNAIEAAYATGTVEPFDRVLVKAKISGAIDLKVREGAHVKKGDLVAVIDSPTLQHDLDRGKADLWAAEQQGGASGPQIKKLAADAQALESKLNTEQKDHVRVASLVASGSVPQIDLDHIDDRIAGLQAQLDANHAQQRTLLIELAQRQSVSSAQVGSLAARLADTEVRSPLDGLVLARFVEPGEVAQVNTTLLKIGTADNLVLECAIDEADVGRVAVGKKVAISLYAFSDKVFDGEVYDILPDADRIKKSFLAKVKIKNPPPGLRSGMTAEVNVVIQERPNSLLLPAEAVDAAGRVLVVSGGRVQSRVPKLGVRDMLRVEIIDGLAEGDEVVVTGGDGLADGTRVSATVKPPADGVKSPKGGQSGLTL
jgi:multidrug efflux pump subunit AcrA (membrane-fusion protein)